MEYYTTVILHDRTFLLHLPHATIYTTVKKTTVILYPHSTTPEHVLIGWSGRLRPYFFFAVVRIFYCMGFKTRTYGMQGNKNPGRQLLSTLTRAGTSSKDYTRFAN